MPSDTDFDDLMEPVVRGFEVGGGGNPRSGITGCVRLGRILVPAGRRSASVRGSASQRWACHSPGRGVLIIADIVMTIAVDPTLRSATALGIIVLVRTF
jgi:hypothetical protein